MTGHPSALRVPFEALYSKRASTDYVTDVGGNAAGGYLVETEITNQSQVEPLRATSCLLRAGATVIESDKHNIAIPRIYIAPQAGSGETSTVTVSQGAFTSEQFTLQAIHYSSQILISKQILAQAADRKIEE